MKKVAVIMGSDSDLSVVRPAIDTLQGMGIIAEVRVISAHRTPDTAAAFARNARDNGFCVIIAAAGKAAHLAGALAANTTLPVIGIPVSSPDMGGMDSLLSTVQMPSGVPVATVAVNGAKNAAVLAAEIIAVGDQTVAAILAEMRTEMAADAAAKDADINAMFRDKRS